jgi:DNA-binding MarR family transcriptional regulator
MVFLHDRGMDPTLTDLCKATGLPKATVSRYISWQLREGLLEEAIDPNDRRRRVLLWTEKGEKDWEWQIEALRKMFQDVVDLNAAQRLEGGNITAEKLLAAMKWRTDADRSL